MKVEGVVLKEVFDYLFNVVSWKNLIRKRKEIAS